MDLLQIFDFCLKDFPRDEEKLIPAINKLVLGNGQNICPVIFHFLSNLELSAASSKEIWQGLISRYKGIQDRPDRSLLFRAAVCDFFCSQPELLKNLKIIDLNSYEETVRYSEIDSLTELYNRRIYQEMLQREIARTERYGNDLSIVFFDIDDFKEVNDRFGHLAGDMVLSAVAKVIKENKRQEDISARYGGEELVLLLPQTGKDKALVVAERIRKGVENLAVKHAGRTIRVTISGGLASFPYDATMAENLQADADSALYRAKAAGKNAISLYSSNRRRHARVNFPHDFMVGEISVDRAVMHKAKGVNISGSGMRFQTGYRFAPGVIIQADIALPAEKPFAVSGKVIRADDKGSRWYDTAVLFLRCDGTAHQELLQHVMRGSMA